MTLADAIQKRRSIRRYKEIPLPEAAIHSLLEAAVCAPSASNRQPWRFMAINEAGMRKQMGAITREAIACAQEDLLPEFEEAFLEYAQHFLLIEDAPTVIVVLHKEETTLSALFKEHSLSSQRMVALEKKSAVMSVSMAVQNLLLSATEQGLGSCVMTGPLLASEALSDYLGVPEGWALLCLVCVGYPDETPQPLRKKTIEHVMVIPR